MTGSPCRDCEYRNPECHGRCQVYKDYAKAARDERIYTNKQRASLGAMWNYSMGRAK